MQTPMLPVPVCGNRRRSCQALLAAFLLALGNTSCSFMFVRKPPDNHRELPEFRCTRSRAMPILDSIFAPLHLVGGIASADNRTEAKGPSTAVGVAGAVMGGVYLASAIYGFRRVRRCRAALAELSARRTLEQSGPRGIVIASAADALVARVWKRSGEFIQGRVQGALLLEPERSEKDGAHWLRLIVVNGLDITTIDARGVTVRQVPVPSVLSVSATNAQKPPELSEVVTAWMAGQGQPLLRTADGTSIEVSQTKEPLQGRPVAGELLSFEGGVQVTNLIRVETAGAGTVSIPVAEIAVRAGDRLDD